jgi:two-component system response regulator FlrC
LFGLSCIIESMRGGRGPAFADPKSIALYKYAARVARSDANVMITGQTGTGKEGVARYIHENSARADKQLVTVNCAAITETMIESILFGHKKGAFTGAYASAIGLFKEADGGTIFLDEITEMPLESQSKLLRVLQEGEILPVGATRHEKIDVRIICAANRNFAEEVKAGTFREDLYWRLNVMPVELEPLASRPADIVAISAFMMMDFQKGQDKFVSLSQCCIERLKAHHWPGNVRELANVLQRALVMCDGDRIEARDLMFSGESLSSGPKQDVVQPGSSARFLRGRDLQSISKSVEYDAITKTLEQTNGNRREAAKELGISERTLRYRMADMRALAA